MGLVPFHKDGLNGFIGLTFLSIAVFVPLSGNRRLNVDLRCIPRTVFSKSGIVFNTRRVARDRGANAGVCLVCYDLIQS